MEQVALGVPPAEIGVVTPYQAQVALLSSLLHEEFPDMTIGSVDGLQGQERDVRTLASCQQSLKNGFIVCCWPLTRHALLTRQAIILSLVRSNPTGDVGFLGEYRRLNVAMTRPRRQLVRVSVCRKGRVRVAKTPSASLATRTRSATGAHT